MQHACAGYNGNCDVSTALASTRKQLQDKVAVAGTRTCVHAGPCTGCVPKHAVITQPEFDSEDRATYFGVDCGHLPNQKVSCGAGQARPS